MKNKIIKCKSCGADIASSAKHCPSCGAKNKKPIYKRIWFWILMVILLIAIIDFVVSKVTGGNAESLDTTTESTTAETIVETANHAFDGDCGISASGTLGSPSIGYPELTIRIKNKTNKKIAAVQFYSVPFNVYDEEINSWDTQNGLYTDDAIGAGETAYPTWQLIDEDVKKVKVYIYSVYFSDGTEWGDKDASRETILKYGKEIKVSGES